MLRAIFTPVFALIGGGALMSHAWGIAAAAIIIGACLIGWAPQRQPPVR